MLSYHNFFATNIGEVKLKLHFLASHISFAIKWRNYEILISLKFPLISLAGDEVDVMYDFGTDTTPLPAGTAVNGLTGFRVATA